ncbi:MAG TPA: nicotinate-nucleotide adenylyltransferase [Oxalicibacterium sp.]|nr:nicotinate-nucleotide adenylyltransferase [Oxalicibacterium sp.]
MSTPHCVAVLGGSFDPPHKGHVALAEHFISLLQPDELRIVPAGNPWQKQGVQTSAQDRVAMVRTAFADIAIPVVFDQQEIRRSGPTYTIDTLRTLRAELGPQASIAFLMGADQLQRLHTWHAWRELFDHAHLCAAARPGFALQAASDDAAQEFARRMANAEQIRTTPSGLSLLSADLSVDIAATELRAALQRNGASDTPLHSQLPPAVLDYIEQHHLYRN